jgi:hypothetical protein
MSRSRNGAAPAVSSRADMAGALAQIAGKLEHDKPGHTDIAQQLETLLRTCDVDALTDEQICRLDRMPVGNPGTLLRMGPASRVEWYCLGRRATRAECLHSLETGFPALLEIARKQEAADPGCAALERLEADRRAIEKLLPLE